MPPCTKKLLLLPLFAFYLPIVAVAQDTTQSNTHRLDLYFDCFRCDEQYIKEHINIVNFVRDPAVAQIQIIITRARTSGGTEVTLRFVGLGKFDGLNNTIVFTSPSTDTDEEERRQFVKNIRLGLLPYIAKTPFKKYVDIDYKNFNINEVKTQVEDPWNHWVFDVGSSVSIEGQETRKSYQLEGRFSADRVTREWKIDTELRGSYERTFVDLEVDDNDTTKTTFKTFSFVQSSKQLNGLVVKSLNQHWSVGGSFFASTSTYNNYKIKAGIGPAVEFNIFPYKEYNRHELSFLYKITPFYAKYNETTIFNKNEQFLIQQVFSIDYEVTETWGEINMGMEAATYLYDLSKNHLRFSGRISFRIFRGLSVFIRGRYSLINDQIYLPAGDITNKQALLKLRDRATGYSYDLNVGISFTFGSIYNNIVNPRF